MVRAPRVAEVGSLPSIQSLTVPTLATEPGAGLAGLRYLGAVGGSYRRVGVRHGEKTYLRKHTYKVLGVLTQAKRLPCEASLPRATEYCTTSEVRSWAGSGICVTRGLSGDCANELNDPCAARKAPVVAVNTNRMQHRPVLQSNARQKTTKTTSPAECWLKQLQLQLPSVPSRVVAFVHHERLSAPPSLIVDAHATSPDCQTTRLQVPRNKHRTSTSPTPRLGLGSPIQHIPYPLAYSPSSARRHGWQGFVLALLAPDYPPCPRSCRGFWGPLDRHLRACNSR